MSSLLRIKVRNVTSADVKQEYRGDGSQVTTIIVPASSGNFSSLGISGTFDTVVINPKSAD